MNTMTENKRKLFAQLSGCVVTGTKLNKDEDCLVIELTKKNGETLKAIDLIISCSNDPDEELHIEIDTDPEVITISKRKPVEIIFLDEQNEKPFPEM